MNFLWIFKRVFYSKFYKKVTYRYGIELEYLSRVHISWEFWIQVIIIIYVDFDCSCWISRWTSSVLKYIKTIIIEKVINYLRRKRDWFSFFNFFFFYIYKLIIVTMSQINHTPSKLPDNLKHSSGLILCLLSLFHRYLPTFAIQNHPYPMRRVGQLTTPRVNQAS